MAYTSSEHINVTLDDRVLRIQFNRPEKKNAITRDMYTTMADAIFQANDDTAVRVILLEGSPGAFTAGNDLADFMNAPNTGGESPVGRFLEAGATTPKPLVASVTGIAVGIGTTLLLHCDLAYASESATFIMPFVNLGLVPEFGSSLLLPQLVGQRRAAELLMLGQPFDATTAKDLGLINQIFPDDVASEEAFYKAQALAQQPPAALRQTKQLMKQPIAEAVANQMATEGGHFASMLTGGEAMEAFQAFMQKRKPDFSNFD